MVDDPPDPPVKPITQTFGRVTPDQEFSAPVESPRAKPLHPAHIAMIEWLESRDSLYHFEHSDVQREIIVQHLVSIAKRHGMP